MKNSPEIVKELLDISPLLAGLEKINVFTVPDGYFDELHLRITNYAILNNTSPVENINKRNLQEVPTGYFETLSDWILAKVRAIYSENAEEELRKLSKVLYDLKSRNIFSVPVDYFDALGDSILAKMKETGFEEAGEELRNLSPMLYGLKGEEVMTIPVGYFDDLSDAILARVKTTYSESAGEELRNLSATLYSLKDKNVFKAPKDYFESFAGNVAKKVSPVPARVITMRKRTSWLKYAAAAVITGIIIITSLQLFKSSSHNNNIATVSLPGYIKESFKYKTEADIDNAIAKLDDADIAKYLEKNGNVLDNTLLINNTDDGELPSSTDYLIDENTLNKYLDKIEKDNSAKTTP